MQSRIGIELMCPEHNEKIISVQMSASGQNQKYCLKCFTKQQIPIEQLSEQLDRLVSKKITKLTQSQNKSEKRLTELKKQFVMLKDQFTQQVNEIISRLEDEMNQMVTNIKDQITQIKLSMQSLTLTSLDQHIKELMNDSSTANDSTFQNSDNKIKQFAIEQYQQLWKSLNIQSQLEQLWEQQENQGEEQQIDYSPLIKQNSEQGMLPQNQQGQYELTLEKNEINGCLAMAMNNSELILVSGQQSFLLVWESDFGQLNLKQTLRGHADYVMCLCFSKKINLFISGSRDKSLRVWKEQQNGDWVCQQVLEGHTNYVTDIVLNNEEDQLISSSQDKKIKVWIKYNDELKWECKQTLNQPTLYIYCLSLSPNGNQFASCGFDKLRIWQKDNDKFWRQQQVIDHPKNDYFIKVSFTEDNEIIATNKESGKLFQFIQREEGIFKLNTELFLNENEEQDISRFSICYNKLCKLAICRHGRESIFVLSKQVNGQFITQQIINGNYLARYLSRSGQYLILAENKINQIQVWRKKGIECY